MRKSMKYWLFLSGVILILLVVSDFVQAENRRAERRMGKRIDIKITAQTDSPWYPRCEAVLYNFHDNDGNWNHRVKYIDLNSKSSPQSLSFNGYEDGDARLEFQCNFILTFKSPTGFFDKVRKTPMRTFRGEDLRRHHTIFLKSDDFEKEN